MSDKELLELAAKAAGFGSPGSGRTIWTLSEYPKRSGRHGALWNYVGSLDDAELWNPLTDDGDALRLAVKLEMRLSTHCNYKMACASDIHMRAPAQVVPWGDDQESAVRQSIVLLAAAIGATP